MSNEAGASHWQCAYNDCQKVLPGTPAQTPLPSCPYCRRTQPGYNTEQDPGRSPAPTSAWPSQPPGSQASDQSVTLSGTGAMGGVDSTQLKGGHQSGQQVVLTQQQMQEMQRIEETRGPQQPRPIVLSREQQQLLYCQQQLAEKQRMHQELKQQYDQQVHWLGSLESKFHGQRLGHDQQQQLMGQRMLCQQLWGDVQTVLKQQQELRHQIIMLGGVSEQQQLFEYEQELIGDERMLKQQHEQEYQRLRYMELNSRGQHSNYDQQQQLLGQKMFCEQLWGDLQTVLKRRQELHHKFVLGGEGGLQTSYGHLQKEVLLPDGRWVLVGPDQHQQNQRGLLVQQPQHVLWGAKNNQWSGGDEQREDEQQHLTEQQRMLQQQQEDEQRRLLKQKQGGRELALLDSQQKQLLAEQQKEIEEKRIQYEQQKTLQQQQQGVSVEQQQMFTKQRKQQQMYDQQPRDEQQTHHEQQRGIEYLRSLQQKLQMLQQQAEKGSQEPNHDQQEQNEREIQMLQEQIRSLEQQVLQHHVEDSEQPRDEQQGHHEQQQGMPEQLRSLQQKLQLMLQQQQQVKKGSQQPNHDQQEQNEQEIQMLQQQIRSLEQRMLQYPGEGQRLSHDQQKQYEQQLQESGVLQQHHGAKGDQQLSDNQKGQCEQEQGTLEKQEQQQMQHSSQQPTDGQHHPTGNEDVRNVQNLTRMWERISQQEQDRIQQEQQRMQQHRQELEQRRRREEQLKEEEQSQQEGQGDRPDGTVVCECGTSFHPDARICANPKCGKPRPRNQPQGPPCIHCGERLIKEGAFKCESCNKKQSEVPAKPAEGAGSGIHSPPGLKHGYSYPTSPSKQQPGGVQPHSSAEMVASPSTKPNMSQSAMVFGKSATITTHVFTPSIKVHQSTTSQVHPGGKENLSAAGDRPSAVMPPNAQQQPASSTRDTQGSPSTGVPGTLPSNQGNDGVEGHTGVGLQQQPNFPDSAQSTKGHSASGQDSDILPCNIHPSGAEDTTTQRQTGVSTEQKQTTSLDDNINRKTNTGANGEQVNSTVGETEDDSTTTSDLPESQSATQSGSGVAPDPPLDDPRPHEDLEKATGENKKGGQKSEKNQEKGAQSTATTNKKVLHVLITCKPVGMDE